jgi:hypothetical protein
MRTGYIVFAHGSRLESGNQVVREAAARLARAGDSSWLRSLRLHRAGSLTAATSLVHQGAHRIVVTPFLTPPSHRRGLARIASEVCASIKAGDRRHRPTDIHMAEILLDRACQPGHNHQRIV